MKKLIEEINIVKELNKWTDIELSHRLGKSDGYISSLKHRPVTTETQNKIIAELEKFKAPQTPKVVPRAQRPEPTKADLLVAKQTPLERTILIQWIIIVVLIMVLIFKSL